MDHVRQLHDACAEGNLTVVVSLLDGELGVDAADDDDTTGLQVAAANGQEQIVRLLLERGATVDKSNSTGWTPLLHAVRHGHSTVAALLLQNGANANARTCFGASAPTLAARSGSLPTCRLLEGSGVSFGVDNTLSGTAGSMWEVTPLMVAAHRGHDTIVHHLLASGNVHYQMPSLGVSALMAAAIGGHVSTTQLLVERGGANTNMRDINDLCSLDIAILRGKRQLREYLDCKTTRRHSLSNGLSEPEIIEFVKQGNIEQVKAILARDVVQRDACTVHDGASPLMFAAMLGHLDIVQVLVKCGCDIDGQDAISGWTALMQATFHGKKAVAKFLISAGADVTIVAKNGCTAFDMATLIEDVDSELYRLLVAAHMVKTGQLDHPIKKTTKLSSTKPDLVQTTEPSDTVTSSDQQQKAGVKAWWNRISNRFHNLKPQKSERRSSFKSYDATLKSSGIDSMVSSTETTSRSVRSASDGRITSAFTSPVTDVTRGHFDMAAMATAKSTLMLSLGSTTVLPQSGNRVVKSVVPPFFPPPSFQADRNMKMPPIGLRKPISGVGNTSTLMLSNSINTNAKILQSQHLTLNLVNRVASPPPRVQFANRTTVKLPLPLDISPSASCNAATLDSSGGTGSSTSTRIHKSKAISSASSSTLTAASDTTTGKVLCNGKDQASKSERPSKSRHSSDQSRHRRLDSSRTITEVLTTSHSSKDSASTLTPVQTPKHHTNSAHQPVSLTVSATSNASQEDLESILQKLSLERYQPIFEEQEVDMEAFLTLTDADLDELGISNCESRQQILSAITELNNNKDRERQHYQLVMAPYADTIRSQRTCSEAPDDCKESDVSNSNWTDGSSFANQS